MEYRVALILAAAMLAGCSTNLATYSAAAADLEHDKAVIISSPNERIAGAMGHKPDKVAARKEAEAEAERVCGMHKRVPEIVSESCAARLNDGTFWARWCVDYRFLFACKDKSESGAPGGI